MDFIDFFFGDMSLIYISIFFFITYTILILLFTIGWHRIPYYDINKTELSKIKISVVIACRNEEENLHKLFESLKYQTYKNFELIVVNDHSSDKTQEILESYYHDFQNFKIVKSINPGKKNSITQGIQAASGELIITTDADCRPVKEWIETVTYYFATSNSDLIIGPVKMIENQTFFSKLQTLEFTSLIASGAGAAGIGMPIMCNGANLAFTKAAWLESANELHYEELSGDDVFLLLSIKKRKGKIDFLKSQNAIVYTQPVKTLNKFIKQRSRWTKKSKHYSDFQIIFTGFIILGICFCQICLLSFSLIDIRFFTLYLIFSGFKFFIDLLFLKYVNSFFKLSKTGKNSLLVSLVYPMYILFIFIHSVSRKKSNW